MATLKDYRDERLRKLAELKELGVNPYPAGAKRSLSPATDRALHVRRAQFRRVLVSAAAARKRRRRRDEGAVLPFQHRF